MAVERDSGPGHEPAMLDEVMRLLAPRRGEVMVDGTLGCGGHARVIGRALGEEGLLIGLDRDAAMVEAAGLDRVEGMRARTVVGNFRALDSHMAALACAGADGVLLDLGFSSAQVDDASRGFSYRVDGPLDMRMTGGEAVSAEDVINTSPEEELARILRAYGEERFSRRIARRIVEVRKRRRIRRTTDLAEIICGAVPRGRRRLHPARRSFQALRIFVNGELDDLDGFLEALPGILRPGGRCVVIAYHSLEDRRVKRAFRDGARAGTYELLTRKPVRPSAAEVRRNPRSRSARVRAVRRTSEGTG